MVNKKHQEKRTKTSGRSSAENFIKPENIEKWIPLLKLTERNAKCLYANMSVP